MHQLRSFVRLGRITFPKPTGININMMPFIIGDRTSIPQEYQVYYPLLEQCRVNQEELGKVGYLSINENLVQANTTHRRGGIHTESIPASSPITMMTMMDHL